MKNFKSFIDLYDTIVKPIINSNPDWIRVDGALTIGNPKIFGKFKYDDKLWRINSDSHIDKLTSAYNSIKKGVNPFEEVITNKGTLTLKLKKHIGFKYLYIYYISKI